MVIRWLSRVCALLARIETEPVSMRGGFFDLRGCIILEKALWSIRKVTDMNTNQDPKKSPTPNILTSEEIEKVYKELGINDEQELKHFKELNKLAMSFEKNKQPIISISTTSTEEGQENGKLE